MKTIELGFKLSNGVFRWQERGIVQVIPMDKKGVPHSYCQICVLGLDEPDPCVVCTLSWQQADLAVLPSWSTASLTIGNHSTPSNEIPANAADVLTSMREPRAIHEWIKGVDSKSPPLRFWLTAAAAYWAKQPQASLAAIDQYLACKIGPEFLERAARVKKIITAKPKTSGQAEDGQAEDGQAEEPKMGSGLDV